MKRLQLKITRANIKNGEQANPGKCPIANSLIENIRNLIYVSVLPNEATIKVKNGKSITAYRGSLPEKGNSFVKNFDGGKRVNPFSLTLELKKLNKNLADVI